MPSIHDIKAKLSLIDSLLWECASMAKELDESFSHKFPGDVEIHCDGYGNLTAWESSSSNC